LSFVEVVSRECWCEFWFAEGVVCRRRCARKVYRIGEALKPGSNPPLPPPPTPPDNLLDTPTLECRLKAVVHNIKNVVDGMQKHSIGAAEKRHLNARMKLLQAEKDKLEDLIDIRDMPELVVADGVELKSNPQIDSEVLEFVSPIVCRPKQHVEYSIDVDLSNLSGLVDAIQHPEFSHISVDTICCEDVEGHLVMVPRMGKYERALMALGEAPSGSIYFPRWTREVLKFNGRSAACLATSHIEISNTLPCRVVRPVSQSHFVAEDGFEDEGADPLEQLIIDNAREFLHESQYTPNDWVMHGPTRVYKPLVENVASSLYGMINRDEVTDLPKQALCLAASVAETWEKPAKEGGRDLKTIYSDVCKAETAAAAIEQAFIDLRRARDAVQVTTDAALDPQKFGVSTDVSRKRVRDYLLKYNTHRNLCTRCWLLLREHRWYPKWEAPVASHALAPLWVNTGNNPGIMAIQNHHAEGFNRIADALLMHKPLLPSLRPFPLPQPACQIKLFKDN